MKRVFLKGLSTGMILQFAVGPVFIYVMNTAVQNGITNGIAAVLAVTLADYIYITAAVLGVGRILEKDKLKKIFTILSSVVLVVFGIMLIFKGIGYIGGRVDIDMKVYAGVSFAEAFILTISSPLTILFWTGLFAAKTLEYKLNKRELAVFGIADLS